MPVKSTPPPGKGAFYPKVDQAFYEEVIEENGGKLPASLLDSHGKPRKLTMSAADRAYRGKWLAIAAKERKSQAVPKKEVKSACVPCALKAAAAKLPPILLPSKGTGKLARLVLAEAGNGGAAAAVKKKHQQKQIPCRNETLVIECSHSEKRNFRLELPPKDGAREVTQFEVIDDGKETIVCTTKTTGPCSTHAGKVFDLYPDDCKPAKTNQKLEFRASHDPNLKSLPFLQLFSSSVSAPHTYNIRTDTCQQEQSLSASVLVYPQIDWDFDISLRPAITDSRSAEKENDFASSPLPAERKSEVARSGTVAVTVCGFRVEFGKEIDEDLRKALTVVDLIYKGAEFCAGLVDGLGGIAVEFKHPDLRFKGTLGRREIEASPKCGFGCDLSIGFSPLVGASVKVDILSFVLTKIPALGQLIERLRRSVKDAIDIAVFLKLEGEVGGAFHYIKVVGHSGDASGQVNGKLEFTAEAHVETKQFRWFCFHAGAEAKVGGHASLSGNVGAGADSYGGYWQGILNFDGFAIYAVLAGGIGFTWSDPPPEEVAYEAPEAPDEGGVAVIQKIDTRGIEGHIMYKHIWTLIPAQKMLGSEEKHPFLQESPED